VFGFKLKVVRSTGQKTRQETSGMNFKRYRKTYNGGQRGFTLVELLLVLVILALIAGLVLPGIIGKAESAKAKAASSQISRISMSVESFYLDTGNTPSSLEELVDEPAGLSGWNGPYIKNSLLKDPWGQDYQYRVPGEHGDFDIWSYGADRKQGGEDNNADITSWE
jgi:general secretion pathway protein G